MPDVRLGNEIEFRPPFEKAIPDHTRRPLDCRIALYGALPSAIGSRPKGSDVRDGNETTRIAKRMFLTMLDYNLGTEDRDWLEAGWLFYEEIINGEIK